MVMWPWEELNKLGVRQEKQHTQAQRWTKQERENKHTLEEQRLNTRSWNHSVFDLHQLASSPDRPQ